MVLADISFGEVLWSMLALFFFVIFLWIIFGIIADVFRSDDLGGVTKAIWCIALVLVPFLTAFIYLIVRGQGMAGRALKSNAAAQEQLAAYARTAGGATSPSATDQIKDAKALLDSGAINADEFERIKASALAKA
jgi:hypothetical protein